MLYNYVDYASSDKTEIVLIETELLFLPGVDVPHVYLRAWELGCLHSLTCTQAFRRALTMSDSCLEIKSAPQRCNQTWQSLEEGAGKQCSECGLIPVGSEIGAVIHFVQREVHRNN